MMLIQWKVIALMAIFLALSGCQRSKLATEAPTVSSLMNDGSRMVRIIPEPPKPAFNREPVVDGRGEILWPPSDPYQRISYAGEIQGALPHGKGMMHWADRSYQGEWRWGKPHGEGVMTFSDGMVRDGQWRFGFHEQSGWHPNLLQYRGVKRTSATIRWPDGALYEGKLKKGKPHGRGRMQWSNGDEYDGEWKNGRRHGEGVQINADGSRYAGGWQDDREHGYGIAEYPALLTSEQGRVSYYRGNWARGLPNGRGERNWTHLEKVQSLAIGPFCPDATMMLRARNNGHDWLVWTSPDGHRLGRAYEGSWLDGDWHGEGVFRAGPDYAPIVIYSQFEHGWPKDRLQVWYKDDYYWDVGLKDRERHGDMIYRNDEYQWNYRYSDGVRIWEKGEYLAGKKPKSIMPGLIAGAAMMAGAKSVGADSATALQAALAFGSDVQNKTTDQSRAFVDQMEVRYQKAKAENDARLKTLLDEAWGRKAPPSPETASVSQPVADSIGQPINSSGRNSSAQGMPEPQRVSERHRARGSSIREPVKQEELSLPHEQIACEMAKENARLHHALDPSAVQSIQYGACSCKAQPAQMLSNLWAYFCDLDYTVSVIQRPAASPSAGAATR
jgi:hypothetical protein